MDCLKDNSLYNFKNLSVSDDKELEKGMRVLGSTMPYSGKHEGYFGIWEGIVISEDHNDVYDVIIKCDDGVVRNAVDKFMRGSVIIEKI